MPFPQLRMPSTSPARTKNLIHGFQAVLIFFAWVLTIAVFTKSGGIDGRTGWFFGVCWLSIPALIYLVAVPTFPRARRFGNVYAFATVDALMIILWFSGWVAVADYVAEGKSKGEEAQKDVKDPKDKKSGCDAFAYGSASKCTVSTATVIFGVVIFLLFISTAFFSFRNVAYFRRTGTMPDAVSDPTFDAQTKAAFSSNPAQDFDEEDEFRTGRGAGAGEGPSHYGQDRDEDYALLQQSEADEFGGAHHHGGVQGAYDPTSTHGGSVMHDFDANYNHSYTSRFHEGTTGYQDTSYHSTTEYGR